MSLYNDQERELLDQPNFAKLVTIMPNGMPQISIMWYRREGDEIRMVASASAQKSRNLTRDPRMATLIDANDYEYVELRGRAELVRDNDCALAELHKIASRYIGDRADAYVQSIPDSPRVILKLRPETVRSDIRPDPSH